MLHPSRASQFRPVLSDIGGFFALSLLFLAAVDIFVPGNRMDEQSLTETAQLLCVLVSALSFLHAGVKIPRARGFVHLVSGAFFVTPLREQDCAFDFHFHSAWLLSASSVSAIVIVPALRRGTRNPVLPAACGFCRTPSACFIVAGFVVLFVFSRVFAVGRIFLKHLLPPGTIHVKTYFQDGWS